MKLLYQLIYPVEKKQLQYVLQLQAYLSQIWHFLELCLKYPTVLLAVLQIIKGNSLVLFLGIIYLKMIQYFSFTSAILIRDRKNLKDSKIITLPSFSKQFKTWRNCLRIGKIHPNYPKKFSDTGFLLYNPSSGVTAWNLFQN